jgi:23S rRNA (uracil1939-C5)-methyltransferase
LPYDEQLKAKQQQVYDQLRRIGHLQLPLPGTTDANGVNFHPILGSTKQYDYRNKLDFGFSNKKWLTQEQVESGKSFDNMNACGFHITGAFDKIYPIEKCWLMDDLHNQIRNAIYDYAIANKLSFFDLKAQTGLLRDLILRNSNSGEWMVILQFHLEKAGEWENEDGKQALALLQFISDNFKEISSLMYLDNQKCNDTIGDQEILTFKGNDHIFELMEDLRFKVGPKSFYQTNTEQAYHLYSVVRAFAFTNRKENEDIETENESSRTSRPLVYDLYTGTGTIANFVAKHADKVIGIEYVPEAIEDAKINSKLNHIDNTL